MRDAQRHKSNLVQFRLAGCRLTVSKWRHNSLLLVVLSTQADQLCWDKTVQALALVDGMECEDADASSQLDLLRQAAVGRLVQLLGSLDDMLNDEDRRQRFCLLPIVALEVRDGALQCIWCRKAASSPRIPQLCTHRAAPPLPQALYASDDLTVNFEETGVLQDAVALVWKRASKCACWLHAG